MIHGERFFFEVFFMQINFCILIINRSCYIFSLSVSWGISCTGPRALIPQALPPNFSVFPGYIARNRRLKILCVVTMHKIWRKINQKYLIFKYFEILVFVDNQKFKNDPWLRIEMFGEFVFKVSEPTSGRLG
jgi:hypothetical protein